MSQRECIFAGVAAIFSGFGCQGIICVVIAAGARIPDLFGERFVETVMAGFTLR